MAAVSGTTSTFSIIGEREDLTDDIWDISPEDTPVLSSIARVSASSTFHEWQTDVLATHSPNNAQIEGDDTSFTTAVATVRMGNHTQISKKPIIVTGTARAVSTAGRADELAYQQAKIGRELRRDMEASVTQNNAATLGTTGAGRKLASMESWIENFVTVGGTGGTTPGIQTNNTVLTAPTDGTLITSLNEPSLKTVVAGLWSRGGDPVMVNCGGLVKQDISAFSGVAPLRTDAPPRGTVTIVSGVDLYRSDFGELRIVPNRFSRPRTVLVLDTEFWAVAMLRPIFMEELAKTGDADKSHLLVEYTLESRNQKAAGKIVDISA